MSNQPADSASQKNQSDSQESTIQKSTSQEPIDKSQPAKTSYSTIWRWHFYAGFFVLPVLIMLAITGLMMMLVANVEGRDGERTTVDVPSEVMVQPVSVQAKSAVDAVQNAHLKQYIAPRDNDMVSVFRVDSGEDAKLVSINPYTAEVVEVYPRREGFYQLMDDIHGTLLIGKTGDFIIETASSLTILMIVTGWYLWWVRQRSMRKSLLPKLRNVSNRKLWWRNSHGATGAWVSVVLFLFLLSGLAWAGIWGGKIVQPWKQFPAEKRDKAHTSTLTHGDVINDGSRKEVPWALELTPMPASDPNSDSDSDSDTKVAPKFSPEVLTNLDTINKYARDNGFEGRYQMQLPKSETGVWTISQVSMSADGTSPFIDRTIHLDQYSGEKLAEVRFDDYNFIGKAMAVGIALHMGLLGWWSILANVIFCLAVIFMCVGGYVMWWKRRPSKKSDKLAGLNPPPVKSGNSIGVGFAILLLVLAVLFPTAIIAIVSIAILDFFLFSKVDALKRFLK